MNSTQAVFLASALAVTVPTLAWVLGPLRRARLAAGSVAALALPLLAVGLYLGIGTPRALDAAAVAPAHRPEAADMAAMVERLQARLQAQPDDLEGWFMLARSRQVLEQWDSAAAAYRRALALAPGDADLLADLADVLAVLAKGELEGEPRALLEQAVAAEPTHAKSLLLLAAADLRQGRLAQAQARWEQVVRSAPAGSQAARVAQESLARSRQ